jgi:hypothetical protein
MEKTLELAKELAESLYGNMGITIEEMDDVISRLNLQDKIKYCNKHYSYLPYSLDCLFSECRYCKYNKK